MRDRLRSGALRRAVGLAMVAALGLSAAACGKKGPPLAPLVVLPDRMMDLAATRLGGTIYVRFTVPSTNIDGTAPADLDRVEVYAYTAFDAVEGRDLKRIRLIASIPVKAPPTPDEPESARKSEARREALQEPGVEQGAIVAISEELTDELRVPLPPDPKAPKPKLVVLPTPEFQVALTGLVLQPEAVRFYVAVGVSRKNKRGGLSPRPLVPLGEAPPPPDAPVALVTESAVALSWLRPPTLQRPYLDAEAAARRKALVFGWFVTLPAPPAVKSTLKGMPPQPVYTYNVYRMPDPDEALQPEAGLQMPTAPPVPGVVSMPVPLGQKPVEGFTYSDPIAQWGVPRCYVVRTVQTVDLAVVESEPSPVTCVTPADVFPPPAPANLAAVASEGAMSLIWERVTAADLAGYLVLRGEAPDGPLEPLFETPIRETTFRDATPKPGVRYVYEVVAVDTAAKPNRSLPSNRVTEAAR